MQVRLREFFFAGLVVATWLSFVSMPPRPPAGNFNTVAIECLQRMNNPDTKFTIACDGHTFNFLTWNGFSECMHDMT